MNTEEPVFLSMELMFLRRFQGKRNVSDLERVVAG